MKNYLIVIIAILFLGTSCVSFKNMPDTSSIYSQTANIAIRDFMAKYPAKQKCRSFKIVVSTHKDLYFTHIDSTILVVNILELGTKLFPDSIDTIGSRTRHMPTQYAIHKDRLFYWYDPSCTLNKEIVAVLNKYDMIDSMNVNGFVKSPLISFSENALGLEYYFCKNNPYNYKSKKMWGLLYEPKAPKLDCNRQKRVRAK